MLIAYSMLYLKQAQIQERVLVSHLIIPTIAISVLHVAHSLDAAIELALCPDVMGSNDRPSSEIFVKHFISFESEVASDMSLTKDFWGSELSLQGTETNVSFGTSYSSASDLPVTLPSPPSGNGHAIGNLLPQWSIQDESVVNVDPTPTIVEKPYENSFVCPVFEECKEDWLSNSSNAPNSTSLVMHVTEAGPPPPTPLLSCSSNLSCHAATQVVIVSQCASQDEEIESAQSLCGCSISYCRSQSKLSRFGCRNAVRYRCKKCSTSFSRYPDLKRHMNAAPCGEGVRCTVCTKLLCRKDALMRHLYRRDGLNPCSRLLEEKQISKEAVTSGRVTRQDIGTAMEIEAAFKRYENSIDD